MPMRWVEPELFLEHAEVSVYHCYKGGNAEDGTMEYWYTTDLSEGTDHEFDVRALQVPDGVDSNDHKGIIKAAIEANSLEVP